MIVVIIIIITIIIKSIIIIYVNVIIFVTTIIIIVVVVVVPLLLSSHPYHALCLQSILLLLQVHRSHWRLQISSYGSCSTICTPPFCFQHRKSVTSCACSWRLRLCLWTCRHRTEVIHTIYPRSTNHLLHQITILTQKNCHCYWRKFWSRLRDVSRLADKGDIYANSP